MFPAIVLVSIGVEQLQVIHDQETDAVLLVHTPGSGAKAKDAQSGGVVDMEWRVVQPPGRTAEPGHVALRQEPIPDVSEVHA
jgi:hypothetical protein